MRASLPSGPVVDGQRTMFLQIFRLVMCRTAAASGGIALNLLQQRLAAIADALPHHS